MWLVPWEGHTFSPSHRFRWRFLRWTLTANRSKYEASISYPLYTFYLHVSKYIIYHLRVYIFSSNEIKSFYSNCINITNRRPGTLFGTHAWKVLENHLPAHLDVLFLKAIPFVEEIGHPYVSHDYFRRQSSREVAFIHKNCFAKVLDSNSSDSAMDNSLSSYGYRALRTCSLVKYVETESAFVFDGSSPTRNHQKFRLCGVYRATTTYSDVSICSFLYSRKLADNFSKALLVYTDMNRSASILRYKSLRKLCPASRDTIPIFPNASFLSPESYGYMATNYVINSLLTEKYTKIINCSHFLISNADNLYHPNIIHYLSRPLLANIGMIAFSFISRYTLLKYIPEFVRDRVDLGSVIVNRACMMATHHLGPFNGDGPGGWFPADGNFFSKAIQYPACTNSLVDRTLFFHQWNWKTWQ